MKRAVPNDQHATYVWNLRRLGRELSDLELRWNAPGLMPTEADAIVNSLLHRQVTVTDQVERTSEFMQSNAS